MSYTCKEGELSGRGMSGDMSRGNVQGNGQIPYLLAVDTRACSAKSLTWRTTIDGVNGNQSVLAGRSDPKYCLHYYSVGVHD